jgi:formylglycine-generating enzyme required for sulfatase activity
MYARTMTVAGAVAILLAVGGAAAADITIETVPVGDPGNGADTRYETPGYGLVSYSYRIAKYEVTAGQYAEFLNHVARSDTYGLYNADMWASRYGCKIQQNGTSGSYTYSVAPDYANRPANCVSFWDACRFANWLQNVQPTGEQGPGTTERGTYTLDGYNGSDGRTIQQSVNTKWAVPSEDEWYKAAYYKGGGSNAGYWDYPTSSNTAPGQDINDASGNNANYCTDPYVYPIDSGKYTTLIGEFQNSDSPYGTFDQAGNVWEWNEAIPYQDVTLASRGLRGGSFYSSYEALFAGSRFGSAWPTDEGIGFGFRVAEVPEPATLALLALGGLAVLKRRSHPRDRGRRHARRGRRG